MTLDSILFYTCDQQNVSADEVKSRSRKGEVVKARQIFTAIAASYGYAFVDIMHFVGRNRTTAYNSMKIANWQLRNEIEQWRMKVGQEKLIAHVGRRAQKRIELREYFEKHPVT
jgi:chromosomal replication initiation ATPase DnaA